MWLSFGLFAPPAEADFLLEDLQVSPRRPLLLCNAAVFTFLFREVNMWWVMPLWPSVWSLEWNLEPCYSLPLPPILPWFTQDSFRCFQFRWPRVIFDTIEFYSTAENVDLEKCGDYSKDPLKNTHKSIYFFAVRCVYYRFSTEQGQGGSEEELCSTLCQTWSASFWNSRKCTPMGLTSLIKTSLLGSTKDHLEFVWMSFEYNQRAVPFVLTATLASLWRIQRCMTRFIPG